MKFAYASGSRPLDGYTIKRGVGVGGFGEVYFATSDAGKEVALKRVQRNMDVELRGVRQCLNLKHVNLIGLYDIRYDAEHTAWVVMEYVSGESLRDITERHPDGMPLDDVNSWFQGISAGVAYLHDHGIVHRDLKPGNIFCDEDVVKIGDYGLSKFISCSRRSGQTESVGTFHYMAPEIGKGVYGKEIDIYALGIILYEMLTGRVPFEGESTQEIIMKHLTADPDLNGIAQPYRSAIEKALYKDPEKRFQNVDQMLAEMNLPFRQGSTLGTSSGESRGDSGGSAAGRAVDEPAVFEILDDQSERGAGAAAASSQAASQLPPVIQPPVNLDQDVLFIGDEQADMEFGPVEDVPNGQRRGWKNPPASGTSDPEQPVQFTIGPDHPVTHRRPPGHGRPVHGRPAFAPAYPPQAQAYHAPASGQTLTLQQGEEPIAGAMRRGAGRFGAWWHHTSLGGPIKFILVAVAILLFILNASWLLPLIATLACLYIAYYGCRAVVLALQGAPAHDLRQVRISDVQYREAIGRRPFSERTSELLSSLINSGIATGLLVVPLAMFAGEMDRSSGVSLGGARIFSEAGWMALTTLSAVWMLLILGKRWETRPTNGLALGRRVATMIGACGIGVLSFGLHDYLRVGLNARSDLGLISSPMRHELTSVSGAPNLLAFMVFFVALFAVVGWWKQVDPLRRSRLSLWKTALCVALGAVLPFAQPWGFLVAGSIAVIAQLAAPRLNTARRQSLQQSMQHHVT